MNLPIDLISKFVKITNDNTETKKESTVYGTARIYEGATYVQLDGSTSELLTPVSTTADVKDGERVTVLIKNHTATITGNLSSPAARVEDVENLGYDIVECDILITGKADAKDLDAESARIDALEANNVTINQTLTANKADIDTIKTDKLDVEDAKVTYANIDFSNINKAAMEYLYSTSGLIKDVTIGDGTITGRLVGVTVSGDLIEGNTVVANKLVIKGEDGLYYKLNTDGMTTEVEQTEYNSLNGSVIMDKSITATKISVDDLVAFDATIGGFNITDNSIYSGAKSSIDNTTQGVYLDNEGQFFLGDSTQYVRYYKDENGVYRLEISLGSATMTIGEGQETINEAITTLQNDVSALRDEIPTKTTMRKPLNVSGNVSINGIMFSGSNKILWSGGYHMTNSQTATLSEAISSQPNGIVLLWSYYVDGASYNSNFRPFFVPKQFVKSHAGNGITMFMTSGTLGIAASKYLYISDTSITGHSNNNSEAADKACGITSSPKYFVLRYVIGV